MRKSLIFVLFLVLMMTGCNNSKIDKDKNIDKLDYGTKSANGYSGLLKESDLPEPFEEYKNEITDNTLNVNYSDGNIIVVDGVNNSINFLNNCVKYLPKDAKYQFNGFCYKQDRTDIIKGRTLAVFTEGNSNEQEGFELLVDNTDAKLDFKSKPIISILTEYKKLGVVKYCDADESKQESGVRIVASGSIRQFADDADYANSFNE